MSASYSGSRLALYLGLGYTLLIVYASLSPFSGWRSPGGYALAYLAAPIPRYVTNFDLALNAAAYVPEGLLVTLTLMTRLRPVAAAVTGALVCTLLSLAMESLQAYLPARVPNNLDVATNALGGLTGALLAARAGSLPFFVERLVRWRTSLFFPGAAFDFGIALVALWFFSQLDPSLPLLGILFFSDGVQAQLAGLAPAQSSRVLGPVSVASNLVAVGLVTMCLMRSARLALAATGCLVVVASMIKMVAATLLLKREATFLWVSQEVAIAIACGTLVVVAASMMARRWVGPLCAAALCISIALAVTKPEEPTAVLSLRFFRWTYGQLLNYTGLASAVAEIWPYAALGLLALLRRRERVTARAANELPVTRGPHAR